MGEETKYKVVRYFDTYPEAVVYKEVTKKEGEQLAKELNYRVRHKPLTEYLVRKI